MKTTKWTRVGRPMAVGLLLLILRMIQNRTGFDPATGLSVPSLPGTVLAVCVVLVLALEYGLALRLPKVRRGFLQNFAPPQGEVGVLVLGGMLLAAGGCLLLLESLTSGGGAAAIAAGLLALASAGGLLSLVKRVRDGGSPGVGPVLPAMFFGVFLVLTVYLPVSDDPVLARYYLPVLAAAMSAYAFSQLAGFLRKESSPRGFTPTANCALSFSLAAAADWDGQLGLLLLFLGCAAVFAGFLLLQREGDLPEPAKEDSEDDGLEDEPA